MSVMGVVVETEIPSVANSFLQLSLHRHNFFHICQVKKKKNIFITIKFHKGAPLGLYLVSVEQGKEMSETLFLSLISNQSDFTESI